MSETEHKELNAWIAENVMGYSEPIELARGRSPKSAKRWDKFYKNHPPSEYHSPVYDCYVDRSGQKIYCGKPFQIYLAGHYTTDPAAAMEVLKKCSIKLWDENPIITKCQHFKVEIWNNGAWVVMQSEKREMFCEAETLELSICLFAKKLFSK